TALGAALAALPAKPENVTDAQLTAVATAQRASREAWTAADAGKLPSPNSIRQNDAVDPAPDLRTFIADIAALRSWTGRMDSLVREANNGRGDLQSIFASVVACQMDPDTAATKLDSIATNRQTVLDQIDSLNPPTPEATAATDTFHTALQHSHEADRYYASWVRNQTDWYYTEPEGCVGGDMPSDDDKVAGDREGVSATAAKKRFVRQYNPFARRFDKKGWTETEI
ncbi:MAG: hypothetical protein H7123_04340, partial [Thermoleophilia bacterium]|nr:hypothetical protein [Thermoleophilia bacterium]